MTLYSYCLRYDDGAAPNPYFGVCTLVICKPAIRRAANVNDWIIGTGSSNSPQGNTSHQLIYAMKVTQKMVMQEYDQFCQRELKGKIPRWGSRVFEENVGDCIFDYSNGSIPILRDSVHGEGNRKTDLSGEFALLSEHFYYFGDRSVTIPDELHPILHRTQGHKSTANEPYKNAFLSWLQSAVYKTNKLYGEPQLKSELMQLLGTKGPCSKRDFEDDRKDIECGSC